MIRENELISKEDVLRAITVCDDMDSSLPHLYTVVENMPPLNTKPKGQWIDKDGIGSYECSNCHDYVVMAKRKYKICPWCDAEMDF